MFKKRTATEQSAECSTWLLEGGRKSKMRTAVVPMSRLVQMCMVYDKWQATLQGMRKVADNCIGPVRICIV